MLNYRFFAFILFLSFIALPTGLAQIRLPSMIGDRMVLQRDQANPIWGWAAPGEMIKLSIDSQSHLTKADNDGYFRVVLRPLAAGGPYELRIEGENSSFSVSDILVGEVWICSGQSNMAWALQNTNEAELNMATADYPDIRLLTVPRMGTQDPQDNFDGAWEACTPKTVKDFSAVGYLFGRRLHHALQVPIGLIDNAWGGSSVEAWIQRDELEEDDRFEGLMSWWKEQEVDFDYQTALAEWEDEVEQWEQGDQKEPRPRRPNDIMIGQHRPGNLYNGVLHPLIGFGIRGAIWYQGESNAGRAAQYRDLFPLMIDQWREDWDQGDFPFYYVQLADFRAETDTPADSDWAELREAQTHTMQQLPNVGQAVIIDVGEGRDIHPRNKQTVADRLARWALARDYDFDIQFSGPQYRAMTIDGDSIKLSFAHAGKGLYAFDSHEPIGFAIAGPDKNFVWADAKITKTNEMIIWSDEVKNPVAVRYGWADNPICNMYNRDGLPMIPFRTDDWPGITDGVQHR